MRNIYILILFIISSFSGFSQSYSTKTDFKTIIEQRSIYLNGGARAATGGKSRTIIPINLPKGTISWYYSFTTSPGESGTKNLNLFVQLSSLAADPTGISKLALSKLQIPEGSHSIDVFVLDQNNADAFIQKVDNNGGTFYTSREGSVTNTRQATVQLSQMVSPCYIGLKNPSMLDGVGITLEVVALVASEVYEDTWNAQNVDLVYNNCLKSFVTMSTEVEQVCDCYKTKIISNYTPSFYNKLSISDRQKLHSNTIQNCTTETGNQSLFDKNNKIKELSEMLRGQQVTKDYSGMEVTLLELISLGLTNWELYNSLAFTQLCLRKNEEAKKNLQIGLG